MSNLYTLDGKTPVPCTDVIEWAKTFDDPMKKRVLADDIDGVHISTVFLGVDHNWSRQGPPILFETMIFGGPHDEYQERCATWEEAEAQHRVAVDLVRGVKR